jgi:hypothetical protein
MGWLDDMYENATEAAQGARESIEGALSGVSAEDVLRYSSPAGYLATEARPQLEGAGVQLRETAGDAAEGAQELASDVRETAAGVRQRVNNILENVGEAAGDAADTIRYGWLALMIGSAVAIVALLALAFYFIKSGGLQAVASVLTP